MLRVIKNRLPPSKPALIEQVRTAENKAALDALRRMQAVGWTKDGTLAGLDLQRAQLKNARLARAEMTGVVLREADLAGAYFGSTQMKQANLENANLAGANLGDVHLPEGNLAIRNNRIDST